MHADQIIVMEAGRIIQTGTHDSLISQGWLYSTLVDLQQGVLKE
jgi:ABC-type multidrug transport system fused ATPase/permease subunit